MSNISDVSKILASFRLYFPNYNPENIAASAKAWMEIVGHIPSDELGAAALACVAEPGRAFAPSTGEVLGKVMELRAQASGLPNASEAWAQLLEGEHIGGEYTTSDYRCPEYYRYSLERGFTWSCEHLNTCGECGSDKLLHPLVKQLAYRFGWPDHFPGDNPEADRAHFMRAYDAEVKRATEREAQPVAVQRYIESRTGAAIAQLAEGMRAK